MRVRMTLGLTDRPGSLLAALESIAVNGGNIISIVHSRDRITGGYVPVSISVEFPSHESVEGARRGIEERGIPVLSLESLERRIETMMVLGYLPVEELRSAFRGRGEVISLTVGGGSVAPYMRVVFSVGAEDRQRLLQDLGLLASERGCLLVLEES